MQNKSNPSRRIFIQRLTSAGALAGTTLLSSGCSPLEKSSVTTERPTAYDLWTLGEKVTVHPKIDKGPGLVKAGNGDVLAFCSNPSGSEQGGARKEFHTQLPPGRVLLSRSKDKGLTWSTPVELPVPPGKEVHIGDPCPTVRLSTGRILVMARAYDPSTRSKPDHLYYCDPFAYYSDDDGQTWKMTNPIDLTAFASRRGYAGGPLLEIDDEVILSFQGVLAGESGRTMPSAVFYRSRDNGITWQGPTVVLRPGGHCQAAAEPAILPLAGGRWVAFVRYYEPGEARCVNLTRQESHDHGRTWSAPEHLGQGAQAHATNLPGGGILLTATSWNGIEARFSYDEGWSFTRTLLLFDPWTERIMPGDDGGYWSQSLLVLDDDTILCGWTSKAQDDPLKNQPYGARDPRVGLAARIRILRRQRAQTHGVPKQALG